MSKNLQTKEKCQCKEKSCKEETCNVKSKHHIHSDYFCEICDPEAFNKMETKEEQWEKEFETMRQARGQFIVSSESVKVFIQKIREEAIESTKEGIAREIEEIKRETCHKNHENIAQCIMQVCPPFQKRTYNEALDLSTNIAKNYSSNTN